jgi:hypothetical protein
VIFFIGDSGTAASVSLDVVGLWVGIISGIVGTVLAIVALAFTYAVNDRSSRVSDQTIRSLQSIETQVGRSSDDTRDLVKGAWEKMLGSAMGSTSDVQSKAEMQQMASGLSAELKESISSAFPREGTLDRAEFDTRLKAALADQTAAIESLLHQASAPSSIELAQPRTPMSTLSELALVLASLISDRHLTSDQFREGRKQPLLGAALRELRISGLLVPLIGDEGDGEKPVYYFPSRQVRSYILSQVPRKSRYLEPLTSELRKVGYDVDA